MHIVCFLYIYEEVEGCVRAEGRASGLKPRSGKGREGLGGLVASESVVQLFQSVFEVFCNCSKEAKVFLSKVQVFQLPPEM